MFEGCKHAEVEHNATSNGFITKKCQRVGLS
jgi:hypothetical protein